MPLPLAGRFALCALGVVLVGCGGANTAMPSDWRPLRLGAAGRVQRGTPACPPVAGTYLVASDLLFTTLIGQHLPAEAQHITWRAYSLQGNADTAITAIVMHPSEGADTMRLQRGVAYRCADGWLVPTVPDQGIASDGTERAVFVAGAKDGALVARLRTSTYLMLPVPCGDGCNGVRVPFSRTSRVRWERQSLFRGPVVEAAVGDSTPQPDTRASRLTRRIQTVLPANVALVDITPHADGWHVSIDLRDRAQLVPLLKTLNSTPGITDARLERRYEALKLEGAWHEVIWLRVTSR